MDAGIDAGLLMLRLSLGVLMAAHGLQKLAGWFNGPGLRGASEYFASLGYRGGLLMAWTAGLTELGAGVLLAGGAAFPLAVAGLVGLLLNVAVAGHAGGGFWNHNEPPGLELPLALGLFAAGLGLTGPGAYAVDSVLGWTTGGLGWFAAAVGGGLVTGAASLAARRRPLPEAEGEADAQLRAA